MGHVFGGVSKNLSPSPGSPGFLSVLSLEVSCVTFSKSDRLQINFCERSKLRV